LTKLKDKTYVINLSSNAESTKSFLILKEDKPSNFISCLALRHEESTEVTIPPDKIPEVVDALLRLGGRRPRDQRAKKLEWFSNGISDYLIHPMGGSILLGNHSVAQRVKDTLRALGYTLEESRDQTQSSQVSEG
jgi:hypothetical protein